MRYVPGIAGIIGAALAGLSVWGASPADIQVFLHLAGWSPDMGHVPVTIAGGMLGGIVIWAATYLIWGSGGWLDYPVAQAMPPRRPLSWVDLGPPPPREQPLPTDLDQPLSAFDPDAIEFRRGRSS